MPKPSVPRATRHGGHRGKPFKYTLTYNFEIFLGFLVGVVVASNLGVMFCQTPVEPKTNIGLPTKTANLTRPLHQQGPSKATTPKSNPPTTSNPTSNPPSKRTADVNIQVAVTTSTNGLEYAMRLWTTSLNGWHQDFAIDSMQVPIYTFDQVAANSPLRKLVTPLKPLFDGEPIRKNNNLLLAALQEVYQLNPHADWYLLAEDDSIMIRENLEYAIQQMNLNPQEESIHGKCVGTRGASNNAGQDVTFAVGGSGILLSAALTKALVPHIEVCRSQFARVRYGDERIGACLIVAMNRTKFHWCAMENQHPFVSFDIIEAANKLYQVPERNQLRIVGLHEKNPKRIQLLQEWIRARKGQDITYQAIHDDPQLVAALEEASK